MSVGQWPKFKWNHSNRQMCGERSSLHSISDSAMMFGLKITHIPLEHYTTGISSNVSSSCWCISIFKRTSSLTQWASLTLRVIKSATRWTLTIGCGLQSINFLLEQHVCQSYVALAMGLGNSSEVWVWTGRTVSFSPRHIIEPNPLLLGRANSYTYLSTRRFCVTGVF